MPKYVAAPIAQGSYPHVYEVDDNGLRRWVPDGPSAEQQDLREPNVDRSLSWEDLANAYPLGPPKISFARGPLPFIVRDVQTQDSYVIHADGQLTALTPQVIDRPVRQRLLESPEWNWQPILPEEILLLQGGRDRPIEILARRFMRQAIDLARNCKDESSARPDPKVGAVLVDGSKVVETAFRGEFNPGDHAEYCLLKKIEGRTNLHLLTLYTTLEPCVKRSKDKDPCAFQLTRRKIGRVVVGMIDPDPTISGKGILHFRRCNVPVDFFDPSRMVELEQLNAAFIKRFERAAIGDISADS